MKHLSKVSGGWRIEKGSFHASPNPQNMETQGLSLGSRSPNFPFTDRETKVQKRNSYIQGHQAAEELPRTQQSNLKALRLAQSENPRLGRLKRDEAEVCWDQARQEAGLQGRAVGRH